MANTIENGIPRIHASRFGGTVRTIYLECKGYLQDPAPPWLQKAFKEGKRFERQALKEFAKKYKIKYTQLYEEADEYMEHKFKFKDGLNFILTASTDAQLTSEFTYDGYTYPVGTFIEVKNMASSNMHKIFGSIRMNVDYNGVIKRLQKYWYKYWIQTQTYLLMHEKLGLPKERGLFLFRNKDSGEMRLLHIDYHEATIKKVKSMGREVAKCIRDNVQPQCGCEQKMCRFEIACRSEKTTQIEEDVMKTNKKEYNKPQELIPTSFVFNVAGITFRKKSLDNTLKEMKETFEGIVLPTEIKTFFEFEPDNEHDPNAIKVMMRIDKKKRHVGYIPAQYQKHIEGLMNSGYFIETHKLGYNKNKPFITLIIRPEK